MMMIADIRIVNFKFELKKFDVIATDEWQNKDIHNSAGV